MYEDLLEEVHLGIQFEDLFGCVITTIAPITQRMVSFNINVSTSCSNSWANIFLA